MLYLYLQHFFQKNYMNKVFLSISFIVFASAFAKVWDN